MQPGIWARLSLLLIAMGCLSLGLWLPLVKATGIDSTVSSRPIENQPAVTTTLFIPLVKAYRPPPVQLSVDFGPILINQTAIQQNDFPLAKDLGAGWVRVWLPWRDIEKTVGVYTWAKQDPIFARLKELNLKPLPVIYGAPPWAAPESCGPISDTAALEAFLEAVYNRYGDQIEAWEFINEPDAREPYEPFGPVLGCWGLQPEKYAAQLEIFYWKIKRLNPGALVLYGGLAYDNWDIFERSFFENSLKHGAGPFFDILSLHFYPINPKDFPSIGDKIDEVQEIMQRNGLPERPIWITETSMWVNGPQGSAAQFNFIAEELTRAYCAGADNLFWFAVSHEPGEPPLHRWLIDRNHQPDNGYYTLQHYAQQLAGTTCTGRYNNVPKEIEAYRFQAPGRSLYVLWSNKSAKIITIPATTTATLSDRDGTSSQVIPAQNGQVSFVVDDKAVFLEILE